MYNISIISLLNGEKMKSITREYAEYLFNHLTLCQSKVYQNENEIRVQLEFTEDTILVIRYDQKKLSKTYQVGEISGCSTERSKIK